MSDDLLDSTVSRLQPQATSAVHPMARLTVVHPPELATRWQVGAGRSVAGRKPTEGDLQLALVHPTVSRAHFAIEWDPRAGVHLGEDLKSHNGSHLDGERMSQRTALTHGALLRLGDVLLVYEKLSSEIQSTTSGVSTEALPGQAVSLDALRIAMLAAATDAAPVLLHGETGTGKESLARELHRLSGRTGPFVALNCATLNSQLVESQLFGHARGAFTGAVDAQVGLFRAASRGTLFLDEIGDLPLALQPKLLRVLQEHEVHPIGSTRPVAVDVRVLAATHHDLARATEKETFRADLYARLSLHELRVPPLRQRRVDLLGWIAHFTRNARPLVFDADAAEALLLHRWPLNLRGVDRLCRELLQCPEGTIGLPALPSWLNNAVEPAPEAVKAPRPIPTREEFVAAFEQHGGSVRALARVFERDRRQIYRWVEAYGLKPRV